MKTPLAFVGGMLAASLMLIGYQQATYEAPRPCPTAADLCIDVKSQVSEVLKSQPHPTPVCPKPVCPQQAPCPTVPPPICPKPECPQIEFPDSMREGCPPPDSAKVAGEYREKMLRNGAGNIMECAPGKDCRADRSQRFARIGQQGATLWFTGLSGSGKTTITELLERELTFRHGKVVYRIDGDNLRTGLTRDLGFSPADRSESVRRASETAALFADAGVITMVTLISPYRDARNKARMLHRDKGLPFLETYLDVPLDVVKARDPKGLYKKAAAGEIKGFTGIDAPYETPLNPEITIPTHQMTPQESVSFIIKELTKRGLLRAEAGEDGALAPPDGGAVVDLVAKRDDLPALLEEAKTLPGVPLRDVDVNWLQVIGEGWASPLRGFMREGPLMQALHFNSWVVDPHNFTGMAGYLERKTDWLHTETYPPMRVSMPVPIVLPVTDFTKRQIEKAKAITLYNAAGKPLAIMRNPEVYEHRKEEIIARCFGVEDPDHPYITLIRTAGNWLVGGEVELLGKIKVRTHAPRAGARARARLAARRAAAPAPAPRRAARAGPRVARRALTPSPRRPCVPRVPPSRSTTTASTSSA